MPSVTLIDPGVLDPDAHYAVTYDGLVNSTSFGQGLISYGGWQYAAWYTGSRDAILARRPYGGVWETLTLPHALTGTDSHDIISVGVCPDDGTIHVAMDTHIDAVYYVVSDAGVATDPQAHDWTPALFSPSAMRDFGGLDPGPITYPWFLATPEGKLQCNIRVGSSLGGRNALLEYDGSWSMVGEWTSDTGSYSHHGATSTSRYAYLHGLAYDAAGTLHATGTWREANQAVCCHAQGLPNHDTWYLYSTDRGRTWRDDSGTQVGQAGTSPVGYSSSLVVGGALPPDYALLNSESMAVDSTGQPHVLVSYIPGRFGHCQPYPGTRATQGRVVHARQGDGWARREIAHGSYRNGPGYTADLPIGHIGRSQIVVDASDNLYVVLPKLRIVAASASSGWADWTQVFDGSGFGAFGECMVDRTRLLADGVLSVAYQQATTGPTSAFCIRDFAVS